jgi:hypothetical protein
MREPDDDQIAFTVASVWRSERVSCPHPDILAAYATHSLDEDAAEFVRFHVAESQCPFCQAVLQDLATADSAAARRQYDDLRDRVLRSTVAALRKASGA